MRRILQRIPPLGIVTTIGLMLPTAAVHAQAPKAAQYLTIGDSAPSIQPARWLKGTPVKQFEKGKLYVVEFWATWCGPCKENIPHLTELQKKYKDQVSIIGVSIWENAKPGSGDILKKVSDFVQKEGAAMTYHVAADSAKDEIAKTWMDPASEKGIPCSFIVGRDGKIAWIGHPAKMEEVLTKVIAGNFDSAAARETRETAIQVTRPIDEAMAAKNYAVAAQRIEKALEQKPDRIYSLAYPYLTALFHTDVDKGKTQATKILTDSQQAQGAYQMIGSIFATQPDLTPAAYQFGSDTITDAIQRWPDAYMFKAMKAEVVFKLGDKAQAIKLAQEALDAAEHTTNSSPGIITLIKNGLAKYQK